MLWIRAATPARREALTVKLLDVLDETYTHVGVLPSGWLTRPLAGYQQHSADMRRKGDMIGKPLLEEAPADRWHKPKRIP